MSLDRPNPTSFQSLRRILLGVLTILVLIKPIFSLIDTLDRPQIQGKFELYQTNLILSAAEWKPTKELDGLSAVQAAIVGTDIFKSATAQYQDARESDLLAIEQLSRSLSDLATATPTEHSQTAANRQTDLIKQTIAAARTEIDRIDLRIGILQAAKEQPELAIKTWQELEDRSSQPTSKNVAASLIDLWHQPSSINKHTAPRIEAEIKSNFDGWFCDRVLHQLYLDIGDSTKLSQLELTAQLKAKSALIKLAANIIPRVLIGLSGVGLILFFVIRLIIEIFQQRSVHSIPEILLAKIETPWTSPWDWETILQVFMLGFFLIGQFILPAIFSSQIDPSKLTTRGQGMYVFTSYLLMASLGISVLYFSIKSYLPLPADWFKFNWKSNWVLWGVGGYLVATPVVIVVSLINDKIWHGQGGSNPLLQIVLESKDSIALLLFFLTAAVAAPLFEEFLFRGFLLPSLTRYMPVWLAICISGAIFGLAHLSLSEVLPLTTLGILLGIVYVRTRNLLAPMLLHSLWNSTTLISLYILGSGN
jgi:uncharacterized protein